MACPSSSALHGIEDQWPVNLDPVQVADHSVKGTGQSIDTDIQSRDIVVGKLRQETGSCQDVADCAVGRHRRLFLPNSVLKRIDDGNLDGPGAVRDIPHIRHRHKRLARVA